MEEVKVQLTREQIAQEVLAEVFSPDTSAVVDTRTLLVRLAATAISAIESFDADKVEFVDTIQMRKNNGM